MRRKGFLILVGGLGLMAIGLYAYVRLRGSVDRTVTEPYRAKDLTVEEIKARLRAGDRKGRIEASNQIHKLAPGERLRVLMVLSGDEDAVARLLAVKHLLKEGASEAKRRLREIAGADRDLDVRDLAISGLDERSQLEMYLRLAEDATPAARLLAIENLALSEDPRAKSAIKKMAATDPDAEVRAGAAKEKGR